jgi:hypothetical protein
MKLFGRPGDFHPQGLCFQIWSQAVSRRYRLIASLAIVNEAGGVRRRQPDLGMCRRRPRRPDRLRRPTSEASENVPGLGIVHPTDFRRILGELDK